MGQVYEGVHDQIKRRAAIKVLHRRYAHNKLIVQRFINEARAVNIVQHPSLVNIYEFGQTSDGSAYIVMEYLDGDTLRQRLERNGGRLPPEMAVRLCRQMAAALAAAHQKGIVHRDLKPVNIMIVNDSEAAGGERAKILDFGLAKVVQPDAADGGGLTGTGTILGTPAYMAPEQCRSARDVDDKSDVYSLGIILYEMLSSDIPFDSETDAELLSMHMYQDPPRLIDKVPELHPDLAGLVHRMLAKSQEDRPSASDVAGELARIPVLAQAAAAPASTTPVAASSAKSPLASKSTPASTGTPPAIAEEGAATSTRTTQQPAKSGRSGLWIVGLFVVLLAAVGGGTLGWLGALGRLAGRDGNPTGPTEKPGPATAPALVHGSLTSTPAGAEVRGPEPADALLGQTPLMIEHARGTGHATVVVRAVGHMESRVELPLDRDDIASVNLRPLPQSVPAVDVADAAPAQAPPIPVAPDPTGSEKIGVQGAPKAPPVVAPPAAPSDSDAPRP